ncbi:putative tape measure protein [Lactobacillus phage Ld25A]|uniref:Putative tape measure protein n=1 Tax=Lactobacillus phage Ld25A TaxID=1500734 RepID=A0A075KQ88_9CAUD|nr:tail length tape measure protein [Lactobacillus phage Ld25A]AIF54338.1 putative tape measure protein [Lactobacillus phage Ld25A]
MAFGGTIKLKGETEYRNALRGINQSLREVNSAMKVVTSEFGNNNTSVTALSRKQDVLKTKLEQQKEKLSLVSQQYNKYKAAVEQAANEHTQLGEKLEGAKQKLEQIKTTLGEDSTAYQKQKEAVDQLQKEYNQSTEAQDKNKQSLSKLAVQMNNAQADVNKTARQIDELGDQLEEATKPTNELGESMEDAEKQSKDLGNAVEDAGDKSDNASKGFTVLKGAIANLASNVIQSAIDGIKGLASEAIESSDSMKKFEQTMKFAGYDDSQIKRASSSMKEYADKTVYDLSTVSNTTAQLASNGVPNFEKLTEAAGNLNAVAGGNQDTFKSVAMVLTQTAGAGKLTTENWNQLADAVPGASGKLQDALKKNGAYTGNFRDAMAKGQITAAEFNKAIMDLGFTDVAQKAATSTSTFEGAMGNLQASVVDGLMKIYDTIGSENITGFINGITNTINTVIPPIKSTINWLVTNLPIIAPLLAGIAAGLGALMVAQKIEAMVSAFNEWRAATAGLTIAQAALNAVQLANPIGLIIAGVVALVAGITVLWNTNKGFRDFVIGAWNGIKETITNVATSVGNFFTQTIPNAFNSAKTAISAWFTNVGSTLAQLPGAFATWLGSALNNIQTWAVNVATNASNAGRQFLTNVVNFFKQLPYNLGYILGTVIGTVVKWVANMATNATNAGRRFLTNIVNFFTQLPGKISNFLNTAITRTVMWVNLMIAKARYVGSKFLSNIVQFFTQLPGRIASFLSNAISRVTSWASSMASHAASAGSRFLSGVVRFISQLPRRIGGFLSSVIGRLGSWAGQMVSAGARGARGMFNAVVNGLASLPGRVASIGSNIVHGIWNGISGAAGWLAGQVRSFAKGIVDGMKGALGIHSPSRVMRDEVGKYMAQGIGVGFEDEMQAVAQQMNNSIPTSFNTDISTNGNWQGGSVGDPTYMNLIDSFKEALSEMKIELDDEVAGKFVNRTVARAIYR